MKKRITAFLLLLTLLSGLAAPAAAWEMWAYPPRKYRTFQGYLDFYRTQEDEGTKALVEYLDQRLAEGDVLTCRGLGKCVVKEVLGESKKGRIMLLLERYG